MSMSSIRALTKISTSGLFGSPSTIFSNPTLASSRVLNVVFGPVNNTRVRRPIAGPDTLARRCSRLATFSSRPSTTMKNVLSMEFRSSLSRRSCVHISSALVKDPAFSQRLTIDFMYGSSDVASCHRRLRVAMEPTSRLSIVALESFSMK